MKLKINRDLQNFLEEFGLTPREIKLYLSLLKSGPNTIMNLSRETNIKRSTTHNNVEELIKKGLVSQTNYGERRMVVAEDPEKLKFLIENKRWEIRKLEDKLPEVVGEITKMIPEDKDTTKVEVKYFESKELVQNIYAEAFKSNELCSFVNLEATSLVFPNNKDLFIESHRSADHVVKEIVEDSALSRKMAETFEKTSNFQFKVTDQMNFSSVNTLIYDEQIVLINLKGGVTATVIRNKDYYEVMKNMFNMLWEAM